MSNTATAPKPAAPQPNSAKPKAPESTPKALDNVPETDAKVTPAPRGGNSAYADEQTRGQVTELMAWLRAQGFTRPSISAVTGYSDSQVWRAQNGKVHASEVEALLEFAKKAKSGEIKPPENGQRKPKVGELQAKIDAATTRLAELGDKASVAQLRAAVKDVQAALA